MNQRCTMTFMDTDTARRRASIRRYRTEQLFIRLYLCAATKA